MCVLGGTAWAPPSFIARDRPNLTAIDKHPIGGYPASCSGTSLLNASVAVPPEQPSNRTCA